MLPRGPYIYTLKTPKEDKEGPGLDDKIVITDVTTLLLLAFISVCLHRKILLWLLRYEYLTGLYNARHYGLLSNQNVVFSILACAWL